MSERDDSDIDLLPMPHTYRCEAFDCGDEQMNAAFREELPGEIESGWLRAFVVEQGGRCQAFVALRVRSFVMDNEDRAGRPRRTSTKRNLGALHIEMLAVDRRDQRRGIAQKIVQHCLGLGEEIWERAGARFVTLASTPAGIKTYEAVGFQQGIPEVGSHRDGTTLMFFDLEDIR